MRRPLYLAVFAVAILFLCLLVVVGYASGFRFTRKTKLNFSIPSLNVSDNVAILEPNTSTWGPCRLSPAGVALFSPPTEAPCIRHYYFFNLDNRVLDRTAKVNATYIPLTVAANLFYVRTANKKYVAANERYHYLYFHASKSCRIDKLECAGPLNATTKKPVTVHPAWVQLKVIVDMLDNKMKTGDVGISLDTDVYIKADRNQSFYDAYHRIIPGLMNGSAPISLIRDGSYWKGVAVSSYPIDINSGIIMFVKTPACHAFFRALWASALIVSPLERARHQAFHFLRHWPWMQERLTWFASDRKWNRSLGYYPNTADYDWHHEQPECFGILCHMTNDKMNMITAGVGSMFVSALDCDETEYDPFCSTHTEPVTLEDWLGRPVVLPYRKRRFGASNENLWNLSRHLIDVEMQSPAFEVIPFR